MRIKIKTGVCWLSGKYLGKHFRRRQYTEQVLLCNLHARYSCFWIIPGILLFIISYSFPTSVKIFLSSRHWKMPKVTGKITVSSRVKEYPTIFYEDDGLLFCKFCCHSVDLKSSTIKDHLQSKSHKNKRELQEKPGKPFQICYWIC